MSPKLIPFVTVSIAVLAGWQIAGEWYDEQIARQRQSLGDLSGSPATRKAFTPKVPTSSRWADVPPPAKVVEVKSVPRHIPSWLQAILVLGGIMGGFIGVILLASFAPHVLMVAVVLFVLVAFWAMIKMMIDEDRGKP